MATTTVDTDTELSAVNSILGSIGQSPITTLNYNNPEVAFVYNILTEVNKDVQNEGWHFNTEHHVKLTPDGNGYITLPAQTISYDITDSWDKTKDVVVRDGRLYDLVDHTDVFTNDLYVDIVRLYKLTDLPAVFQRYIAARASSRAAAQLVSNPRLVQMLQQQEAQLRASCMEYECQVGDPNFMGWPHETSYKSYQPYVALQR
tara:strand:+ start:1475 stop:2083 length:609 start_codon:yes stop_codon:yes gene_type:complete